MIVEGIDFLGHENPYLVGRKAIAISISDIAACAGLPRYALVSLGIPNEISVKFVDKLFKGMLDLSRAYKINLVGGDLSRSERLIIDVSMLGMVERKNLVLRNGAKKGDIIFVTGKLGGSIFGKHLRFIPRLKEARFLVRNFKINSMIDISDGLAQDLGHLLKESKQGAVIYEELIPQDKKARNLNDALYMGEDFELLFTISHSDAGRLLTRNRLDYKPIGEIREKKYGLRLVDKKGKERSIEACGFQHFR
jgi:thiamine-monophosphate kinase